MLKKPSSGATTIPGNDAGETIAVQSLSPLLRPMRYPENETGDPQNVLFGALFKQALLCLEELLKRASYDMERFKMKHYAWVFKGVLVGMGILLASCDSGDETQLVNKQAVVNEEEASSRSVRAGGVMQISTNIFTACARMHDGSVTCWGWNANGQLGQGHTDDLGDAPGEIGANLNAVDLNGTPAVHVAVGLSRACAALEDGILRCWGKRFLPATTDNIGDVPNEMGANLPAIDLGANVESVSLSDDYGCALLWDQNVKCWGDNNYGRTGGGADTFVGDVPSELGTALATLPLGGEVTTIYAGQNHACAMLENGDVKCWGANDYGQIGQGHANHMGDADGEVAALNVIPLGRAAMSIAVGPRHSCAVLLEGTLKCWGYNQNAELGLGYRSNVGIGVAPGEIENLSGVALSGDVVQVYTGAVYTCAHMKDETTRCWGDFIPGVPGAGNIIGDTAAELTNLAPLDLGGVARGYGIKGHSLSRGGPCVILDDTQATQQYQQEYPDTRFEVIRGVKCWIGNFAGSLGQGKPYTGTDVFYGDDPGETIPTLPFVPLSIPAEESN